ncbi:glycosyltransferase family 4 protein [Marinicellulosiphila megalodicopiae]|uniref:glycosyltransferase family 4 protein n=1 Tax=Marinicellulosiphila megalodicopiae TaxID=2724896 RepID=UPI003BB0CC4E
MEIINFIQDEATPHNNILIKNVLDNCDMKLWYAVKKSKQYNWNVDLNNEIIESEIYGTKLNFRLLKYFLAKHKVEKFLMVGWSNSTTRVLFILAVFFRLNLFMWFDLPDEKKERGWLKIKLRKIFYFLLKNSKIQLFCAGKNTVEYFILNGFNKNRLHNLPIQVEVVKYKKFNSRTKYLKIFAGSRLTFDKGFDLLIAALGQLERNCNIKLNLAGEGPELNNLKSQSKYLNIADKIEFLGWISPLEYQNQLSNCDVFIHPARKDAYGATVLALASGTPVIGSNCAGAVNDCLIEGENGFSYSPESVDDLMLLILRFYEDCSLIKAMSDKALYIANQYDGKYWAKKLVEVMK